MALARVAKVLCYVVRDGHLLVFRHRDYPDAGVQVPAGTLHEGEDPAVGALRETEEETGRRGFRVVRALGRFDHEFRSTFAGVESHEVHVRHVYLVEPPGGRSRRAGASRHPLLRQEGGRRREGLLLSWTSARRARGPRASRSRP